MRDAACRPPGAAGGVQRAVGEGVGAELLDDDDLEREALALADDRRPTRAGSRASPSSQPSPASALIVSRGSGSTRPPRWAPSWSRSTSIEVHRRRADEARDEDVVRPVVEVARGVDLLQVAVLEHAHPVAHGHGLDLVVGDVDGGRCRAGAAAPRSRCGSAPAAWRRGWTAARPSGTPAGCARSPGPWPPAAAGHRRAPSACGRGTARGRGSCAASSTRLRISSFFIPEILSAKPMLSATVMCGYSA